MLSFDGHQLINFYNNNLWFAAENNYFLQLYKLNTVEQLLKNIQICPAAYGINFSDSNVELITLNNNGFRLVRLPEDQSVQESTPILAGKYFG